MDLEEAYILLAVVKDELRCGVFYGWEWWNKGGAEVGAKYDPNQPRDYHGEFESGGGGGGGTYSHHLPPNGQEHEDHVMGVAKNGFNEFEFSEGQKRAYLNSIRSVLVMMAPEAKRRLAANLKKIKFYRSLEELNKAYPSDNASITYGGYIDHKGEIICDGGDDTYSAEEVYAHELGHAIDGMHEISDSAAWKSAWQREIQMNSKLSDYGAQKPADGFAEFARLLYATHSPRYMRTHYPACYAVWKMHGLVD